MTAAANEGDGSTFRILFAHTKLSLGGSINESGKVQKISSFTKCHLEEKSNKVEKEKRKQRMYFLF